MEDCFGTATYYLTMQYKVLLDQSYTRWRHQITAKQDWKCQDITQLGRAKSHLTLIIKRIVQSKPTANLLFHLINYYPCLLGELLEITKKTT